MSKKPPGNHIDFEHVKKSRKGSLLSIGAIVVLVMVLIAFVGMPLTSGFGAKKSIVFGRYKNQVISYNGALNPFFNQVRNQTEKLGANAPTAQVEGAWRRAFDNVSIQYIIRNELQDNGYFYNQTQIDQQVLDNYFTSDGNPNPRALKQAKEDTLIELNKLAELSLYLQQWSAMQSGILPTSDKLTELMAMAPQDLRKLAIVYFQLSDYPLEEVENYFKDNSNLFDEIELSRITVATTDVESLELKLAEKDSDFAALAKEYSNDFYREQGGEMGKRTYANLQDLIEDDTFLDRLIGSASGEVLKLEQPETTIFFRIDKEKETADWQKAELHDSVRRYIERNELSLITDYNKNQAELLKAQVLANDDNSLLGSAKDEEVANLETDYIALAYGNNYPLYKSINKSLSEAAIAEAASNSELFLRQAFSIKKNEISEPILLNGKLILLLQLLDERPATLEDSAFGNNTAILDRYSNFLLSSLITNFEQQQLLKTSKLQDNFTVAFARLFRKSDS